MDRTKRRMPCNIKVGGRRYAGMVLDFSASGLFIQTTAKASPGEQLQLELSLPGEQERMGIDVEVARKKVVPPRLMAVAQGGIGVRILSAPESFYRFAAQAEEANGETSPKPAARPTSQRSGAGSRKAAATRRVSPPESAPESAPEPEHPTWCVRVSQTTGPRSRRILVQCADAEGAGRMALEELGKGWKVLEVEPQ